MKKVYKKPLIVVETMDLSEPIALNCTADKDTIEGLKFVGVFTENMQCYGGWLGTGDEGTGGKWDWDMNHVWDEEEGRHDRVCYHSNIDIAFLS